LGAETREKVQVGDFIVMDEPLVEMGDKIVSKALDNRIACWLGIEAIRALAERGPLPFVCFPQAIAAHSMLRRRGIPVVLYYGVARNDEKGLHAHVWVKDGEVPVVGCRAAAGFTVLHVFAPHGARRAEAGR